MNRKREGIGRRYLSRRVDVELKPTAISCGLFCRTAERRKNLCGLYKDSDGHVYWTATDDDDWDGRL